MEPSSHDPSTTRGTKRGLGLAVAAPEEVILAGAAAASSHGYTSFWLNNPPNSTALRSLAQVAEEMPALPLGVGVIPLAPHQPVEIVEEVESNRLPQERLYLGIGSGSGPGGVDRVRHGVRALRAELTCDLVVAALGPKMCRLAGAEADGVLFNWLTPAWASRSIEWVRAGAEHAGCPMPRLMAYVRVALGDQAIARLQGEAGTYEGYPAYAAHFKRMGVSAMGTAVTGATPQELRTGLAAWDGVVDELVIRAMTAEDTVEEVDRLIEAASPEMW